ncbi:Protein of unknown function [Gryllus bimaculatus]|nr:Protein of unknown function [Gryllus bimaculatus]
MQPWPRTLRMSKKENNCEFPTSRPRRVECRKTACLCPKKQYPHAIDHSDPATTSRIAWPAQDINCLEKDAQSARSRASDTNDDASGTLLLANI